MQNMALGRYSCMFRLKIVVRSRYMPDLHTTAGQPALGGSSALRGALSPNGRGSPPLWLDGEKHGEGASTQPRYSRL